MAIGSAEMKGPNVWVYNERGTTIFNRPADDLIGYTSTTVTIKKGRNAYTYNEKGVTISTKPL